MWRWETVVLRERSGSGADRGSGTADGEFVKRAVEKRWWTGFMNNVDGESDAREQCAGGTVDRDSTWFA